MERTFNSYSNDLLNGLLGLTDQKKFFFGVWCCQYLYTRYAKDIPQKLSWAGYEHVADMMEFLWKRVDDFNAFDDEDAVYDHVETVREIDPMEELLPYDQVEGAITNLLGSIEDVMSFIIVKDHELIASGPENIINVVYLVLTNELGLDDSVDPDVHFNHPLVKEEVDKHFQLLNLLKNGPELTSKDRDILC